MSVGSPTAGTWSSSQWRPDNEFETDRSHRRILDSERGGVRFPALHHCSHCSAARRATLDPRKAHAQFALAPAGLLAGEPLALCARHDETGTLRVGHLAGVVAEGKLVHVAPDVTLANVMKRLIDAALQEARKSPQRYSCESLRARTLQFHAEPGHATRTPPPRQYRPPVRWS